MVKNAREKAEKKPAEQKAPKPAKAKEVSERTQARAEKRKAAKELNEDLKAQDDATNATVGPVKGTLEAKPEKPAKKDPKLGQPESTADREKRKAKVSDDLTAGFKAIEDKLIETNGPAVKKQPRQLRWALKSLEAAKDAALNHVRHNV